MRSLQPSRKSLHAPVLRGRLPKNLLRFFREPDHALSFLDGCIRLGELWSYRKAEGMRQDALEGEGQLVVPGVNKVSVQYAISFHNPVYVLSLCSPCADVQTLASRFGRFMVRIRRADRLAAALFRRLADHSIIGRDLLFGDQGAVAYNKGTAVRHTPSQERRTRLSWIQKPEAFSAEREHRIVFALSAARAGAPSHICVPLPSPVEGLIEEVPQ